MEIHEIHPLHIEEERFEAIQQFFADRICLENRLDQNISLCAGVDAAYWEQDGIEWGVCSIVVLDYKTKKIVEKTYSAGRITVPYAPGFLSFRELPLVVEAAKKLVSRPDLLFPVEIILIYRQRQKSC